MDINIEDINALKSIKNRLGESGKKAVMKRPILNMLSLMRLQFSSLSVPNRHLDV